MKKAFFVVLVVLPVLGAGKIKITPMAGSVEVHYYTPGEVTRWPLASLPIELPGPGNVVLWNQWWDQTNFVQVETTSEFAIPDDGFLHVMVGQPHPTTNSSVQPGPHRAYVVEERRSPATNFWVGFRMAVAVFAMGLVIRLVKMLRPSGNPSDAL